MPCRAVIDLLFEAWQDIPQVLTLFDIVVFAKWLYSELNSRAGLTFELMYAFGLMHAFKAPRAFRLTC